MKTQIKYIIIAVLFTIIGAGSMYYVFTETPLKNNKQIYKTVSDVSVTESDTIQPGVEKAYNSVVVVKGYANGQLVSTGTGFVYKKDNKKGYLITNHHVIESAASIKVVNMDGMESDGKLLGSDEYSDLAVISIDEDAVMGVATLGDSTKLNLGDTLFTVGSPMGEEYKGTVTKGILSGKDRTVSIDMNNGSFMMEVLQTDAAINPGNSGGPLCNVNGEVIGVNSMKLVKDTIEGMGFAIPIEVAKNEIENLEKGKKVSRPIIGVSIVDANNAYALYYNNIKLDKEFEKGVAIVSVDKGNAADKAGLKSRDVILKIGDTEIKNTAHFRYVLYKYGVGDKINIKYYRNGKEHETTVKLEKEVN